MKNKRSGVEHLANHPGWRTTKAKAGQVRSASLRASLVAMTKGRAANPGPLEKLVQKLGGRLDHCQMCGHKDHLEPAFKSDGKPAVLCLHCRIGAAELLEGKRGEMENVLQLVAAGNTEIDQLEAMADGVLNTVTAPSGKRITKAQAEARASLIPESDWIEREGLHQCQNCRKTFTSDQLREDIPHYHERVAEGEEEPSGECPDCGALCHPVSTKDATKEFVEMIARFTTSEEHEPSPDDAVETVDSLIAMARDLMKRSG